MNSDPKPPADYPAIASTTDWWWTCMLCGNRNTGMAAACYGGCGADRCVEIAKPGISHHTLTVTKPYEPRRFPSCGCPDDPCGGCVL